ncbi:MAG: hypothetical protein IPO21_10035 [Bacteroidales bacterium]|nr:hypothetical protein [Bacteroidales bacterium]
MKRKIIFAFFSFLLLVTYVNAQDSTEVLVPKLKKNEITTTFSTFPSILSGAFNINTNRTNSTLYLSYKRAFNKVKLRTSIYVESQESSEKSPDQIYVNDSSFSFLQKSFSKSNTRLHIGLQNNSKAKKVQFPFGADLVLGVLKNWTNDNITNYKLTDGIYHIDKDTTSTHLDVFEEGKSSESYFYFGIAPVLGFDYIVNSYLSVGFLVNHEIFYKIRTDVVTSNNGSIGFTSNYLFTVSLKF